MTEDLPTEQITGEFKDIFEKSEGAGIADEGAADSKAIEKEESGKPEALPS